MAVSDEYLAYQGLLERHFEFISREAWTLLLLQIFRVFLVERISGRQIRASLPTASDEGEAANASAAMDLLNTSNTSRIYSNSEAMLMKWVAFHYNRLTKRYARINNFEDSFRDGVYLACLLRSHIPHAAHAELHGFEYGVHVEGSGKRNAQILGRALQNILPGFRYSPERIATPFLYDTLFLVTYLFLVLPEFAPKGDIVFRGRLHERIVQGVEITNPTGKALTYLVNLEGGGEYSVREATASVPAKGTARYAVEYFGRFSRAARAQLTLRSSKMTLETASVLVFNLVSEVEKPGPVETLSVEAPVYAAVPVTTQLDVRNPFPMRGKFTVSLKIFKVRNMRPVRFSETMRVLTSILYLHLNTTLSFVCLTVVVDTTSPVFVRARCQGKGKGSHHHGRHILRKRARRVRDWSG